MPNIRLILNKLKWTGKIDKNVEIWYIHRGVPNNTMMIRGTEIINIGRSFLETTTAMIPYHRITTIKINDDIIFQRYKKTK
ncbi:MAG: RNA repair domain-containing protein [Candidatus Thermoplasmatota archaeon]